jgi:hypothetical protein
MGSLREPRRGTVRSARFARITLCPARLDPTLPICCADRRVGSNSCVAAHQTDGVGWARCASRVAGLSARRASRESPFAPLGSTHAPDLLRRSPRGFEFMLAAHSIRTGWDSNPRGREPTRFPIVRLKPLGHPSSPLDSTPRSALCSADRVWVRIQEPVGLSKTEGVGWLRVSRDSPLTRFARSPLRPARLDPTLRDLLRRSLRGFESKPVGLSKTEGVGFEPTRTVVQRLSRAPP